MWSLLYQRFPTNGMELTNKDFNHSCLQDGGDVCNVSICSHILHNTCNMVMWEKGNSFVVPTPICKTIVSAAWE